MKPLAAHKANLTILQGLSGKMCTTGHHSWCSSLGVFKANERISSIKWATVDFELAKLFPSPMEHIELACFPLGGGNARGTLNGIATASPPAARSSRTTPSARRRSPCRSCSSRSRPTRASRRSRSSNARCWSSPPARGQLAEAAPGPSSAKVQSYADSLEAIRERNRKVDAMADAIRPHVPKLDAKYLADEMTTVDRQRGHAEVLLAALISGLTNVVAFTVDELGHEYTGLPGLETEKVNLHDVGHGKRSAS